MKRPLQEISSARGYPTGTDAWLRRGLALGIAALAFCALASTDALAWPTKYSTPSATCKGSAQVSTDIEICGGLPTGAPYGVELQWMPADAFTGVWPAFPNTVSCRAYLNAKTTAGKYSLEPGECVTVSIGDTLRDQNASVPARCNVPLQCGTDYVFRVAAREGTVVGRSKFTGNLTCGTLPCTEPQTCTYTQGFWKTHGPAAKGGNTNEWPVTSLTVGSVVYTDVQLQSIFDQAPGGNGLVSLAHQLIAAKLNVASGADATDVAAAIAAADLLIGANVIPPVGGGSLDPSVTSPLTESLADYNEGKTGPGHCGK
jgi:hypothetical protein